MPARADTRVRFAVRPLWVLLVILLAALTLRLTLFMAGPARNLDRAVEPDSQRYLDLAANLHRTGTFGLAGEDFGRIHIPLVALRDELGQREPHNRAGLYPEVFRTPGYPALIALVRTAGLPAAAVLLVQIALSAGSIVLVYALGRSLSAPPAPALAGAAVVALHPADAVFANTLLSETLFVALLLAGVVAAVRARRGSGAWAVAGGAVLGLATLVRPVAVLIPLALVLWLLVTLPQRRTLAVAAVLVAASLLPAGAWMARNAAVGFGWRLSNVGSLSSYFYTAAYTRITARGGDTQRDWPTMVDRQFRELRTELRDGEDAFAGMSRLTRATLNHHRGAYLQALMRSGVKFTTDHSMGELSRTIGVPYQPTGLGDAMWGQGGARMDRTTIVRALPAVLWVAVNALLATLMLIGLARLLGSGHASAALLLAGLWTYFLLTTQTSGLERFRLPVLGVQALAAAGAIWGWGPMARLQTRR